jgi:hypothetical protein
MTDEREPKEESKERFNPFLNEGDMFKVLLYVAGACAVIALLALLIRSAT